MIAEATTWPEAIGFIAILAFILVFFWLLLRHL